MYRRGGAVLQLTMSWDDVAASLTATTGVELGKVFMGRGLHVGSVRLPLWRRSTWKGLAVPAMVQH